MTISQSSAEQLLYQRRCSTGFTLLPRAKPQAKEPPHELLSMRNRIMEALVEAGELLLIQEIADIIGAPNALDVKRTLRAMYSDGTITVKRRNSQGSVIEVNMCGMTLTKVHKR